MTTEQQRVLDEDSERIRRDRSLLRSRKLGIVSKGIKPQRLYLTANGSFRVLGAHSTSFRCGPHKMIRTINYTVKIGSRPELLDERGFIIDWQDIFQAVAKKFRYVGQFPSCESFAAEILALVYGMLGSRCTSLTVDVGIDGLPAHMTAEYTPEG